jgi:methyltransferase (TIGR00027 family)
MLDRELSAVGGTALIVANCRARLSRREQPWFVDPLALHLASVHPDWDEYPIDRRLLGWIGIRTRYLDELVLDSLADGNRQLVILGAGLDARAFRLPLTDAVSVFELDRAEITAVKRRAVAEAGLPPAAGWRLVTTDLTDDWLPALHDAGWSPEAGTIWLAEGLLIYLEAPAREELLSEIRAAATQRDILGMSVRTRRHGVQRPIMHEFETPPTAEWFAGLGWRATLTTTAQALARWGLRGAGWSGTAGLVTATPS